MFTGVLQFLYIVGIVLIIFGLMCVALMFIIRALLKGMAVKHGALKIFSVFINKGAVAGGLSRTFLYLRIILAAILQIWLGIGILSYAQSFSALNNMLSIIPIISIKGDKCTCYARCHIIEEDKEINYYTSYELLYGTANFSEFVDALDGSNDNKKKIKSHDNNMKPSEKQKMFQTQLTLQQQLSGEITNIKDIKLLLNEDAAQKFKDVAGELKGINVSNISYDKTSELLFALFNDAKTNGRNVDCPVCGTARDLDKACSGEEWDYNLINSGLWTPVRVNPHTPGAGGRGVNGTATGPYTIKLNDGTYFWWHQSSELCDNNYEHPTYGRTGSVYAGSGTMAARGCGIYTVAICLSNIVGEPISPLDVVTDFYSKPIEMSAEKGTWAFSYDLTMDRAHIAQKINERYGDIGVEAYYLKEWGTPGSVDKVREYMTDPEYITYIVSCWGNMTNVHNYSKDEVINKFSWYRFVGDDGDYLGHYMALRKVDEDDLAYGFTSCCFKYSGTPHEKAATAMSTGMPLDMAVTTSNHTGLALMMRRRVDSIPTDDDPGDGDDPGIDLPELDVDAEKVKQILLNSQFAPKAESLARAYSAVKPLYGSNAAIGLMANIWNEGNAGVVEYSFSKYGYTHAGATHGFKLPSGGTSIQSIADLHYLKDQNWDTTTKHITGYDNEGKPKYCSPASCGLGSVQWSFDRRIALVNIYLGLCHTDEDVKNKTILQIGEVQLITNELTQKSYGATVSSKANASGGTVQAWAEAFCDYYELPAGWCGKDNRMTGTGSACKTRMGTATEMYNLLASAVN